MVSRFIKFQIVFTIMLVQLFALLAQEPPLELVFPDERPSLADSASIQQVISDTLPSAPADTLLQAKPSGKKDVIEAQVTYSATDSMIISVADRRMYLYGNATVNYTNIDLKAWHVQFDMSKNVVTAMGRSDTIPEAAGKPVFTQGAEKFESDTINYNFQTRKGVIKQIVTQQGDGFLQAQRTKRHETGHIHIKGGRYTTCDQPHPHFYIGLTKAIAIPEDKIISGPAYFVMEDIPFPFVIPFGFFPNSVKRSAGILFPTYGEENRRGIYLRDGGFYIPISDYVDFALQGEVYTKGTWGLNTKSAYVKRYRYRGSFAGSIKHNNIDDEDDFPRSNDYRIFWSHSQDAKANPTRSFSANVNLSSSAYDRNHSYNMTDRLTSTRTSSISYSKRWGSLFNLNTSLNHNQNNQTGVVNLDFPKASFSVGRIYPFRPKNLAQKPNFIQNIQVSYNANLDNKVQTTDSLLFTRTTLERMHNGFSHTIPVSLTNIKVLKYINITPSLSYRGMLYGNHIQKRLPDGVIPGPRLANALVTDTIRGLKYAHAINTSIGVSANPKLYGMFATTRPNSSIQAVRHVLSPSAGFNYTPDISKYMPDYYRKVALAQSVTDPYNEQRYSIFENSLYGTPVPAGQSGSVSLGLGNNLEMKVLSRKDTANPVKKVSILDNLNFNSGYQPFKDSMRWNYIGMNGATRLFNNMISINMNGQLSPYALDRTGREFNSSYFSQTGKLVRLTSLQFSTSMNFRSGQGGKKKPEASPDEEEAEDQMDYSRYNEIYGDYVDFDIPWSLQISYSWAYSKPAFEKRTTSSVRVSGDVSLTAKWKLGGNTGYDFTAKKFSATNISISRDLHCWEMRMSLVPFGQYKSYSFTINAKSALLRDLKWDKQKSWYDYL